MVGKDARLVSGMDVKLDTGAKFLLCTGACAIVENLEEGAECGGVDFGSARGCTSGDLCGSGVGAIWRGSAVCVLS
jgi:hypothetical protein